jgi:AcrR family transcriptional regulator
MPRPSEDRILAAAEQVFADKGYGACSLRDVLAAAECSTTAFYARFKSKEAVLEALIAQLLGDLHDAAAEVLPRATDIALGWDAGIDLLVATLSHRKGLMKLALTEAGMAPGPRTALRSAYASLASLLSANLRRVADRGRIEVADTDALAWAIVGGLNMQVMRWSVFEELDDAGLAESLRATARALLPRQRRRRTRAATDG